MNERNDTDAGPGSLHSRDDSGANASTALTPGSPRLTDPGVLDAAASANPDALPVPALDGDTLASFALSRSNGRLSRADLNRIGLALLQEATGGEDPDWRAAASIFGTMASVNKPSPASEKPSTATASPEEKYRRLLSRSAKGLAARRQVLDVEPEK